MLRKLVSALAVAFVVTLGSAGVATAAPYDPPAVAGDRVPGGGVQILGSGFGTDAGADTSVTVTVVVNGVTSTYTFAVDSEGNFTGTIPGIGDNAASITVVGNQSGKTKSVQIAGVSQSTDATTTAVVTSTVLVPTTVAVPTTVNGTPTTSYMPSTVTSVATIGGNSGSSGGGYWNNSGSGGGSSGGSQGAYTANGTYTSGLANTGASIAGPMAIGIGTLTAGLGLLFFGTRGVIRRRGTKSI